MLKCFVVGCDNKSNKKRPGISFHTFPKNYELRLRWLNVISRPEFKPSKGSIICSNHFNENDSNYTLCRLRLKDNVCPFLSIPNLPPWQQAWQSLQELNLNVSYEEKAVDTVVSVLNAAKEALGERQTLKQLATSRDVVSPPKKVALTSLKCPIPVTSEKLIRSTIEKTWKLTETFMYTLKYTGSTTDECSQYYYFEAVFSQPTAQYPIPQATVSVFFRVEDKQIEPPGVGRVPVMKFRIEGHRWDLDVRHVLLISEWLLAVLQMKMKFYRRIEEIRLF